MPIFRRNKTQPVDKQSRKDIEATIRRASGVQSINSWQMLLSNYDKEKIGIKTLQYAVDRNGILWKGYNKKARDIIYDWFIIDTPLDGRDVPEDIEETARQFMQEHEVQKTMMRSIYDSLWSGNGYIEYVTDTDKEGESVKIDDQDAIVFDEIKGNLTNIAYIDPLTIKNCKLDEYGEVEYWVQRVNNENRYIHRSRIYQFAFYKKGTNAFGFSPTQIAADIVRYDINSSKSLSELIHFFSHPYAAINTGTTSDKDLADAYSYLEKVAKGKNRIGLAYKKDGDFKLHNPNTFDPSPILNHFYIELSATLEMPMMLLIGEQKGKLTGSEVEMNDYYKHIQALQNIHISPAIFRMFKLLFDERWNYPIQWNPLFTDELHEAEIKKLQSEAVWNLYEKGLIELHEGRQLLREYDIGIPEGGDMDNPDYDEEMDAEFEQPGIPVVEIPDPDSKPSGKSINVRKPTDAELKLIKQERELGKKLIKEGAAK